MLYRRSPSMSGTSLRIAIARLNGSTNRHSAITGGSIWPAKCQYTPRLTTTDRTPEMHRLAATG